MSRNRRARRFQTDPLPDRAVQRIRAADTELNITAVQADIRDTALPRDSFDVAVAAATLHHLRGDAEWQNVFSEVHGSLKAGGSFWIWDLVTHEPPVLHELMWRRYGEYLTRFKGPDYREPVLASLEAEDTPRTLGCQWQLRGAPG